MSLNQMSVQLKLNHQLRSRMHQMSKTIIEADDSANRSKIELINLRGRLRKMEFALLNLKEAKGIDRKVMEDRLAYTADTAEWLKNEAQFQFKRLADFHKLFLSDNSELFELDIHSAKDKTMDVKSVETKDDQINSQTNKLRNPKVDVKTEPDVQIEPDSSADESILQLKQENTRLASALTCSVCSNMYTAAGNHIPAKLRCCHIFCKSCVQEWLTCNNSESKVASCPTCRTGYKRQDINLLNLYPI